MQLLLHSCFYFACYLWRVRYKQRLICFLQITLLTSERRIVLIKKAIFESQFFSNLIKREITKINQMI